jgi:hypothetical protein
MNHPTRLSVVTSSTNLLGVFAWLVAGKGTTEDGLAGARHAALRSLGGRLFAAGHLKQ